MQKMTRGSPRYQVHGQVSRASEAEPVALKRVEVGARHHPREEFQYRTARPQAVEVQEGKAASGAEDEGRTRPAQRNVGDGRAQREDESEHRRVGYRLNEFGAMPEQNVGSERLVVCERVDGGRAEG
jgi:hypothetical protein